MRLLATPLLLFLLPAITTGPAVASDSPANQAQEARKNRHRVFITTDISNGQGDPDDRQSLCHLLYYADELDIRGIVPDRFQPIGDDACRIALDLYEADYNSPGTRFRQRGYPTPDELRQKVYTRKPQAIEALAREAQLDPAQPLYVLAWGNLNFLADALDAHPEIAPRLRLLSIGTNIKARQDGGDGSQINWNGPGRNRVFDGFPDLWWVESDWTYNGMFPGNESVRLKETLAKAGGKLGIHIKEVIDTVDWADNFRAGDTPSVLYLLDPDHDPDDPTTPSWAGRFVVPFADRPHYWTGINGGLDWNYANPQKTWQNADAVLHARVATLLEERPRMYEALLRKVHNLYPPE